MKTFIRRFRNARTAVQQIRRGEWVPRYNRFDGQHIVAHRDGMEMWIGNGAWFCEITGKGGTGYFGLFWRHYVWWAAARKMKRDADRDAVPILQ